MSALLLIAGWVAGVALAQQPWQVDEPVESGVAGTVVAWTENAEGYRFSVTAGPTRHSADCRLTLPEAGSESLTEEFLVTLTIDANEPLTVLRWQGTPDGDDGGDFFEVIRRASGGVPRSGLTTRWVALRCWPGLEGQESPASGALREILDGDRLLVRFATVEGGPQGVAFSLDGAREAIVEALGISAVPSPKDVAQDELLRFRFDYRSNTCYLLGGRKRQKRCLQAVERCAEQVHDSVLSMRECLEGK